MDNILYIDRSNGKTKTETVSGAGILKWLYLSATGKLALHLLIKRKVFSALGGWYMNNRLSANQIQSFVEKHNINLKECQISDTKQFNTFNDFFYRKLKDGVRPLGKNIVSPADGKILVFQSFKQISSFFVKGNEFTLESFVRNKNLSEKFENGSMAIVRLAPADYHRYHFPASGFVFDSVQIKGKYFSVSPLALRGSLNIFCENKREYCVLKTEKHGDILIVDVGATMVGGITQTYNPDSNVKKGDEKGYFSFGGSTIVLFFEKDKVIFDVDLISNTKNGFETAVKMGENIAK